MTRFNQTRFEACKAIVNTIDITGFDSGFKENPDAEIIEQKLNRLVPHTITEKCKEQALDVVREWENAEHADKVATAIMFEQLDSEINAKKSLFDI